VVGIDRRVSVDAEPVRRHLQAERNDRLEAGERQRPVSILELRVPEQIHLRPDERRDVGDLPVRVEALRGLHGDPHRRSEDPRRHLLRIGRLEVDDPVEIRLAGERERVPARAARLVRRIGIRRDAHQAVPGELDDELSAHHRPPGTPIAFPKLIRMRPTFS